MKLLCLLAIVVVFGCTYSPPEKFHAIQPPPQKSFPISHSAKSPNYEMKLLRDSGNTVVYQLQSTKVTVEFEDSSFAVSRQKVLNWVIRAATSVAKYYKKFPMSRLNIVIKSGYHSQIGYSRVNTFRGGGVVTTSVGKYVSEQDLQEDWVLVHEISHLGFPNMNRKHRWIEEGLATYLETIIRGRYGLVSEEKAWMELVEGLPNGLPQRQGRGLDGHYSWGTVYWGGALYWFLADIEIRQKTNGKYGVEDALAGINRAGGNMAVDWSIRKALQVGDQAVGVAVLEKLYDEMRDTPKYVDLEEIIKQLGLGYTLKKDAPLAWLRDSIMHDVKLR